MLKQDAKMHIEVIMYAFAIVSEFLLALNFIFTVFLLALFILTGYNILSIQLLWTSKISLSKSPNKLLLKRNCGYNLLIKSAVQFLLRNIPHRQPEIYIWAKRIIDLECCTQCQHYLYIKVSITIVKLWVGTRLIYWYSVGL